MKKMNLLVMSLVSAAALSFTSCSSNDDLAGDNAGQEKVDGFYMTLNVQTPKADGTRTVLPKDSTIAASAAESDVTSGTIYLVDANGNIVFKKPITESDWKAGKPTQDNDGSTQLNLDSAFFTIVLDLCSTGRLLVVISKYNSIGIAINIFIVLVEHGEIIVCIVWLSKLICCSEDILPWLFICSVSQEIYLIGSTCNNILNSNLELCRTVITTQNSWNQELSYRLK